MTTYAHVIDGTVREIVDLPDNLKPGIDVFTPEFAADLVPCSTDIREGWIESEGGFFAPPPPTPPAPVVLTVQDKRDALAKVGFNSTQVDALMAALAA